MTIIDTKLYVHDPDGEIIISMPITGHIPREGEVLDVTDATEGVTNTTSPVRVFKVHTEYRKISERELDDAYTQFVYVHTEEMG